MANLRRLVGRKSARSEAGLFVVQGRVLVEEAVAAGIDVRVIGDCRAPRGLMVATAEGHAAGNAI